MQAFTVVLVIQKVPNKMKYQSILPEMFVIVTEGYLLNPDHPKGSSKAKFMKEVLGYSQSDSKLFHKNVVDSLIGKNPTKSETTPFGTKHTFNTKLIGKDGKSVSANVVVVIQKDNGRITHKIVTVYPDKKGN